MIYERYVHLFCLKYLHLFMYSNLWNCSYSLLPIRPPQFCFDEAKIGKIFNFYSVSRQGGGQSRRPSKGQIPVCADSGANTLNCTPSSSKYSGLFLIGGRSKYSGLFRPRGQSTTKCEVFMLVL